MFCVLAITARGKLVAHVRWHPPAIFSELPQHRRVECCVSLGAADLADIDVQLLRQLLTSLQAGIHVE